MNEAKKVEMICEDWQNNSHRTSWFEGGNYITRGGPRGEGLQELKRGTYIKFLEVKVLLSQLSYEETVHRFSFKK